MLTRSQVAKRLGKSLATVRRLEGLTLHPRRDANGVHRFDAYEVSRVAAAEVARRGGPVSPKLSAAHPASRQQSEWFARERAALISGRNAERSYDPAAEGDDPTMREVASSEVVGLRERVRQLEGRLAERVAVETKFARDEARERESVARDLIIELEGLTNRQLRRLGPETLAMMVELIDEVGAAD